MFRRSKRYGVTFHAEDPHQGDEVDDGLCAEINDAPQPVVNVEVGVQQGRQRMSDQGDHDNGAKDQGA